MKQNQYEIDYLTQIYNENYFKRNYQKYLEKFPNAQLIIIDFEKFKTINDTFGHNVGDLYLITFAQILKNNFSNSIVVRLHGDEFAILTNYTEEEIAKRFELCDKKISLAVQESKIPKVFSYNAGSTKAEHGIDNSKEKADYMMYYAKQHQLRFQSFKEEIWNEKEKETLFLKTINNHLKNDSFSYSARAFFDKNSHKQKIYQICTKDLQGNSIFQKQNYRLLRENFKLKQIDLYNIQHLLENLEIKDNQIMISIDYKTILSVEILWDYLNLIVDILNIDLNKIILSINIEGITEIEYTPIIKNLELIRQFGFQICLDQYNSKTADVIWENIPVQYIKFQKQYWLQAMISPKIDYNLHRKVEGITHYQDSTIPIFNQIETLEEVNYLSSFMINNILLSGNYYSNEKKLVLKK